MTAPEADGPRLALEDAADLVGESRDALRRWQELGLLRDGDSLSADDLGRARLISFAARRGVSPEELARIVRERGDLLEPFVSWAARPARTESFTPDAAAEKAGVTRDIVDRVWTAAGLHDQTMADKDDIDALHLVATTLEFGLPMDALLQIVRVLADTSTKAAETMTRVFHLHVHERFRAQGLTGETLMAATQSLAEPLVELVEPAVMYFHRKAWDRANREDLLVHLLEETTPVTDVTGELYRTVLFVDLSNFTPLTEAMGDTVAARIVDRFSELVREYAARCDGQVIKQIGDEFMLVFPTATAAVRFGIDVRAAAASEPQFPALRIGANTGSVLYRDGDYLGANVNLAARVASAAGRNQFVVTDPVRTGGQHDGGDFVSLGHHTLKGVSDPVELFEVRPHEDLAPKHADPVCGMELDEGTAEARLEWKGERLLFCSERCLQRFLASLGAGD